VNIQFIQKLTEQLNNLYIENDAQFQVYAEDFANTAKRLKTVYYKDYKPTVNSCAVFTKKLYNVFKMLDDELINKERKRNNAIKKLRKNIHSLSEEIKQMADNLKAVADNTTATKTAKKKPGNWGHGRLI